MSALGFEDYTGAQGIVSHRSVTRIWHVVFGCSENEHSPSSQLSTVGRGLPQVKPCRRSDPAADPSLLAAEACPPPASERLVVSEPREGSCATWRAKGAFTTAILPTAHKTQHTKHSRVGLLRSGSLPNGMCLFGRFSRALLQHTNRSGSHVNNHAGKAPPYEAQCTAECFR